MKISFLYFFLLIAIVTSGAAHAQVKPFFFAGDKVKPGTKQSFLLPVISG